MTAYLIAEVVCDCCHHRERAEDIGPPRDLREHLRVTDGWSTYREDGVTHDLCGTCNGWTDTGRVSR